MKVEPKLELYKATFDVAVSEKYNLDPETGKKRYEYTGFLATVETDDARLHLKALAPGKPLLDIEVCLLKGFHVNVRNAEFCTTSQSK